MCKEFKNEERPSYGDIDLFLVKKGLGININNLGSEETPEALKGIDDLWKRVLNYFNNNK